MSNRPIPENIVATEDMINISRKLGKGFMESGGGMKEIGGLLLGSADRLTQLQEESEYRREKMIEWRDKAKELETDMDDLVHWRDKAKSREVDVENLQTEIKEQNKIIDQFKEGADSNNPWHYFFRSQVKENTTLKSKIERLTNPIIEAALNDSKNTLDRVAIYLDECVCADEETCLRCTSIHSKGNCEDALKILKGGEALKKVGGAIEFMGHTGPPIRADLECKDCKGKEIPVDSYLNLSYTYDYQTCIAKSSCIHCGVGIETVNPKNGGE